MDPYAAWERALLSVEGKSYRPLAKVAIEEAWRDTTPLVVEGPRGSAVLEEVVAATGAKVVDCLQGPLPAKEWKALVDVVEGEGVILQNAQWCEGWQTLLSAISARMPTVAVFTNARWGRALAPFGMWRKLTLWPLSYSQYRAAVGGNLYSYFREGPFPAVVDGPYRHSEVIQSLWEGEVMPYTGRDALDVFLGLLSGKLDRIPVREGRRKRSVADKWKEAFVDSLLFLPYEEGRYRYRRLLPLDVTAGNRALRAVALAIVAEQLPLTISKEAFHVSTHRIVVKGEEVEVDGEGIALERFLTRPRAFVEVEQ